MSHSMEAGAKMTKGLVTVPMNSPLNEAFQKMRAKNIRHLPVTDDQGDIVGILSDRDLHRAMSPQYDKDSPREMSFRFDPGFVAKDFMSWPVHKVHEETELIVVAKRMLSEKLSALLVENDQGHDTGILTTDDLLMVLISLLEKGPVRAGLTLKGAQVEFGLNEAH